MIDRGSGRSGRSDSEGVRRTNSIHLFIMHIVFSIHFIDFINSRAYIAERGDNAYGSRFHACPIIIYTRGE